MLGGAADSDERLAGDDGHCQQFTADAAAAAAAAAVSLPRQRRHHHHETSLTVSKHHVHLSRA